MSDRYTVAMFVFFFSAATPLLTGKVSALMCIAVDLSFLQCQPKLCTCYPMHALYYLHVEVSSLTVHAGSDKHHLQLTESNTVAIPDRVKFEAGQEYQFEMKCSCGNQPVKASFAVANCPCKLQLLQHACIWSLFAFCTHYIHVCKHVRTVCRYGN